MLSILPDRSTSPFSTLKRFTCKSFPFTVSSPCSVSKRTSFKSKDNTSKTPVTELFLRWLSIILCGFCTCLSSNRHTFPLHFYIKYMKRKVPLCLPIGSGINPLPLLFWSYPEYPVLLPLPSLRQTEWQ